ncbi:carbohydrate kinase family protein [Verrucomicrobium spinosum]|uniref:carbohydrate kinase family protein n=1 Tax=Verrucomicrobium spinosum TaxID=2736 RepID=UPI000A89A4CB|nr:carbohydrate kinase family protein [Verrucomicrobium spinosum]
MLASILGQTQANGGGPYNVLKDLAAMGATFPLAAAGMVGEDDNGRWIREDCRVHGINTAQLHATKERATSYTDAMTVAGTGRRTFFHQRGANALFDVPHVDFRNSSARIFHLGYLMLLDTLDSFAPDGRTHASHLLEQALLAGLETSVDMVSTEHPQFREIALSALPYTHHLMLNEVEAARVLHRSIPADQPAALLSAASDLLGLGVRQSVTVHTEHGCASVTITGEKLHQPPCSSPRVTAREPPVPAMPLPPVCSMDCTSIFPWPSDCNWPSARRRPRWPIPHLPPGCARCPSAWPWRLSSGSGNRPV